MTYSTRKRLFIAFTIVFFISVPLLVLYTQGYRTDFQNKKLVKTGGLDISIDTLDTTVYLDNKLKKETNFIFRNAVFRNIIPKVYSIHIEKDGYIPWEKNVSVEEEQVTKFVNIKLFPQSLSEFTILKNAEKVFVSTDSRYAVTQTTAETDNAVAKKQVLLVNLETLSKVAIIDLYTNESVQDVEWDSSSNTFSVKTERKVYLFSTLNSSSLKDWTTFLSTNFPAPFNKNNKIIPASSVNSVFVVQKELNDTLSVHYLDIEKKLINRYVLQNVIALDVLDTDIFYLDKNGLLQKLAAEFQTTELSPTAIAKPNTSGSKLLARSDGEALLVITNNNLFLWQKDKPLEKIGSDVKGAMWWLGDEKLVYWNTNKAYVYWLKKVFGTPQRLPADREIVEINDIKNIYWATESEQYLGIETAGQIVFASIDPRDTRQVETYDMQKTNGSLTVNLNQKNIYVTINSDFVGFNYK